MTDLSQQETRDLISLLELIEKIQKYGYDPKGPLQNLENKFRGRDLEMSRRRLHTLIRAKGKKVDRDRV